MKYFIKVLMQWGCIAALVVIPLLLAPFLWPFIAIFCWIVAFGLITLGIVNPAFILIRFLVWGGATVIGTAALSTEILSGIKDVLIQNNVNEHLISVFNTISSVLLAEKFQSTAIVILAIVAIVEIVRIITPVLPKLRQGRLVFSSNNLSKFIILDNEIEIRNNVSLTNYTSNEISISGCNYTFLAQKKILSEMYPTNTIDQVSEEYPFFLKAGKTQNFEIITRTSNRILYLTIVNFYKFKLNWIVNLSGKLKMYGHHLLNKAELRVSFE